MLKTCERPGCDNQFMAKRSTAKYCSSSCRAKMSGVENQVVTLGSASDDPFDLTHQRDLADAVVDRVEQAGLAGTPEGMAAIAIAAAMTLPINQDGSKFAALYRQLTIAFGRLDALAPSQNAMDDLRMRRDRKRARPA